MSSALDAPFFMFGWAYVFLAPYAKVEESFNLHATHDILARGINFGALANFDHFVFSGPIPRTFIGSILLAGTTYPLSNVAAFFNLVSSKADFQIIARLVLATWNAVALSYLRKRVLGRFGRGTALFFTLLTCSQFHLLFWMGRTLPNMFALPLVNVTTALLLEGIPNTPRIPRKSWTIALWLLGFCAVIFRVELLLLWIPISLQLLLQGQAPFLAILTTNIFAGVAAAATTLIIDSYFWQHKVLPEISSFIFNVAQGQSSNWGVSPFRSYYTVHLPKLLMTGFPMAFIGCFADTRVLFLLLPYFGFVFFLSNLGHKEWRFIIYTVPVFNVAAARGFKYLTSRRKTTLFGQICFVAALGALASNFLLTGILVRTSMANYPGGAAISMFHQLLPATTTPPPHVHICNLAAQSGTSLFQHLNSPPYPPALFLWPSSVPPTTVWIYNKTEGLTLTDLSSSPHFTHLISEIPPAVPGILEHWRLMRSIPAFDRVVIDTDLLLHKPQQLLWRALDVIRLEQKDVLWIYERK